MRINVHNVLLSETHEPLCASASWTLPANVEVK